LTFRPPLPEKKEPVLLQGTRGQKGRGLSPLVLPKGKKRKSGHSHPSGSRKRGREEEGP